MLTDADREDFQHAIELIRAVIGRHPTDVTAPIITAMQLALHDIDVIQKHLAADNSRG